MRKKNLVIAGCAVIVIALGAAVIFGASRNQEQVLVADVPPVVEGENPQLRTIEVNSELMGTVEPDSLVYVTPLGAGEITSVNIKAGDQVQAGQVLCVIDTKQVESSRIAVETARISYEEARQNLDRYTVLHQAGAVSDAEYQNLQDSVELARLQYESAQNVYNIQLESSQVTAPISGVVESCDIQVHDMASQQTVVCVIAGEGGKSVEFYASERIVNGLKAGDPMEVEKSGSRYDGVITEVGTMVDPTSGLFKVKASVTEAKSLATGTSVKLYVTSQKAENVLTVPVDSVYYEGGEPFIYVYSQDGTLKKNPVEVGLADSQYIQVIDGISSDDLVITTWTSELYDGSRVELVDSEENETEALTDGAAETSAEESLEESSAAEQ